MEVHNGIRLLYQGLKFLKFKIVHRYPTIYSTSTRIESRTAIPPPQFKTNATKRNAYGSNRKITLKAMKYCRRCQLKQDIVVSPLLHSTRTVPDQDIAAENVLRQPPSLDGPHYQHPHGTWNREHKFFLSIWTPFSMLEPYY